MTPPKRIAVDFDGTLCDNKYPEIGSPKTGAKAALVTLRRLGYQIIIWTCRTCHWDYDVYGGNPAQPTLERDRVKEMVAWLDKHGFEYDLIDDGSKGKPSADFYIDDKGIRFHDNWIDVTTFILGRDFKALDKALDVPPAPVPVAKPAEGQTHCRVLPFRPGVKPVPNVETTRLPPK
jgi:hypothetical protein